MAFLERCPQLIGSWSPRNQISNWPIGGPIPDWQASSDH